MQIVGWVLVFDLGNIGLRYERAVKYLCIANFLLYILHCVKKSGALIGQSFSLVFLLSLFVAA